MSEESRWKRFLRDISGKNFVDIRLYGGGDYE